MYTIPWMSNTSHITTFACTILESYEPAFTHARLTTQLLFFPLFCNSWSCFVTIEHIRNASLIKIFNEFSDASYCRDETLLLFSCGILALNVSMWISPSHNFIFALSSTWGGSTRSLNFLIATWCSSFLILKLLLLRKKFGDVIILPAYDTIFNLIF